VVDLRITEIPQCSPSGLADLNPRGTTWPASSERRLCGCEAGTDHADHLMGHKSARQQLRVGATVRAVGKSFKQPPVFIRHRIAPPQGPIITHQYAGSVSPGLYLRTATRKWQAVLRSRFVVGPSAAPADTRESCRRLWNESASKSTIPADVHLEGKEYACPVRCIPCEGIRMPSIGPTII
jgi:hypothetical protein